MTARSSDPATAAAPSPRARTQPAPAASRSPYGTRCMMHAAVAFMMISAVCGVARAQGTWSTAQLSVARYNLAATSVGNVAIFAGGAGGGVLLLIEGELWERWLRVCACASCLWVVHRSGGVACVRAASACGNAISLGPLQVIRSMPLICTTVQQGHGRRLSSAWGTICLQLHLLGTWPSSRVMCCCGFRGSCGSDGCVCVRVFHVCGWSRVVACVCAACACRLRGATAGGAFNAVDVYNGATGAWSTAQLSVARIGLAATSVGNVAIFAGGQTPLFGNVLLEIVGGLGAMRVRGVCVCCMLVGCVCAPSACRLMRSTAGSRSNAVDLYNSATGAWSTAQLSVARSGLTATSVGNVAIFAGGATGNVVVWIEEKLFERCLCMQIVHICG
jgi:hypothetical protein